MQEEGG